MTTKLNKCRNHDHFWIQDHVLYESYNTLRGMRYRAIMAVASEDNDRLSDEDIKYIEDNYLFDYSNLS
jgi:hypothetical protein